MRHSGDGEIGFLQNKTYKGSKYQELTQGKCFKKSTYKKL